MWWALAASEHSSARFQFFWEGLGQEWAKTLGSPLDFFPGRQTEKEEVVREEPLLMRRTDATVTKRKASGRNFCFRRERRQQRTCSLWINKWI